MIYINYSTSAPINIDDIQHCSEIVSFILFTDDTALFHSKKSLNILNEIIQKKIEIFGFESDW